MIARAGVFAVLAAATCCGADLYLVAGTVTNALTRSPIPHAQVYIYKSGTARPSNPYITGPDGRFSFSLPAGSYALHAGIRGTTQNYGSRNDENPIGSAVIVGPGKDTANLVFRFFPPASISGKVLDDSGEPVEDALVQLIRTSVAGGVRQTSVFRYTRANDLGEYRLGWIPGGAGYYITVTGEPWFTRRAQIPGVAPENTQAYAPVYYPGTSDASQAAAIKIGPGEEMHADFTLRTVVGANVVAKYEAPVGSKGMVSLMYDGIAGTTAFQQQQSLVPLRSHVLFGVPPGSYTLRVTAASGNSDLIGFRRVEVNGSEVTVDVPLHAAASVSGTLAFQNPGTRPSGSLIMVLTRPGFNVYTASVKADGTFRFNSVLPGKYQTSIRSAGGYFVSKMEVKGSALRDGLIEIADGDAATVAVTASDETGSISGFVKSGDQPLAGVLAVLAPVGGGAALRYRGFQTESDGSFDFRNLPAGDYRFFAIEDTGFEYSNAELVRPYLAAATPVRIEAHKASSQDIVLVVAKP